MPEFTVDYHTLKIKNETICKDNITNSIKTQKLIKIQIHKKDTRNTN